MSSRYALSERTLFRHLMRLHKGVRIYDKKNSRPVTVTVRPTGRNLICGEPLWQCVVYSIRPGRRMEIEEIWEAHLKLLRKVAVGYFPSLCRHFGPARIYAQFKPWPAPRSASRWRWIEVDAHGTDVRIRDVSALILDEVTDLEVH